MAKVTPPTAKPSDYNGLSKHGNDGNPASDFSNVGGPKGAMIIGNAKDASAGKLKTYKTKVANLNTGAFNSLGSAMNISDRSDA